MPCKICKKDVPCAEHVFIYGGEYIAIVWLCATCFTQEVNTIVEHQLGVKYV